MTFLLLAMENSQYSELLGQSGWERAALSKICVVLNEVPCNQLSSSSEGSIGVPGPQVQEMDLRRRMKAVASQACHPLKQRRQGCFRQKRSQNHQQQQRLEKQATQYRKGRSDRKTLWNRRKKVYWRW